MTDMLTCAELIQLLTEYLDGVLDPGEKLRVDRHLDGCEHCFAYLEQFRRTIALTGRLSGETVPPAARAELLERFREWKLCT